MYPKPYVDIFKVLFSNVNGSGEGVFIRNLAEVHFEGDSKLNGLLGGGVTWQT